MSNIKIVAALVEELEDEYQVCLKHYKNYGNSKEWTKNKAINEAAKSNTANELIRMLLGV